VLNPLVREREVIFHFGKEKEGGTIWFRKPATSLLYHYPFSLFSTFQHNPWILDRSKPNPYPNPSPFTFLIAGFISILLFNTPLACLMRPLPTFCLAW
jgi:hypothetical protein